MRQAAYNTVKLFLIIQYGYLLTFLLIWYTVQHR